jgi:hypothetical protein
MRKIITLILICTLSIFCFTACNSGEYVEDAVKDDTSISAEGSDLTIYANGGTLLLGTGSEQYEAELSAGYMEVGTKFADVIGSEIQSITKDGSEFAGWTVYAVTDGEWVMNEETELADNQLCMACGSYGYYLMNEYELISESLSTDELESYENDGRNYYAFATWK